MNTVSEVVVLGHTGFLGGVILNHLRARNVWASGASSAECDLLNAAVVKKFFQGRKAPFGLVIASAITRRRDASAGAQRCNREMIAHLVAALAGSPVTHVVFLSTVDVYGACPVPPITEDTLINPTHPYARTKLAGEKMLSEALGRRCAVTHLRLPGVYGAGDRGESILGGLARRLKDTGFVAIHGTGEVKRDYVTARDVARAVENLFTSPYNGVINLACGHSRSILEWAGLVAKAMATPLRIELRDGDVGTTDLIFDVARLATVLPGFVCQSQESAVCEYSESLKEKIAV